MNKRLAIKQRESNDCGVACLVSIMNYYGFSPLYEEVKYLLRVDKSGTNAYNIINGARNMGFDGFGTHYSYEDIVNNEYDTYFKIDGCTRKINRKY